VHPYAVAGTGHDGELSGQVGNGDVDGLRHVSMLAERGIRIQGRVSRGSAIPPYPSSALCIGTGRTASELVSLGGDRAVMGRP
jgi:hypothetical protein